MPGRKYTAAGSGYRYGFNGQENSDEIATGLTTAMYWEYDSRIGRRWNVDPVPKIWESPYLCFSGNPIWFSDPHGDDAKDKGKGKKETSKRNSPKTLETVVVYSKPRPKQSSEILFLDFSNIAGSANDFSDIIVENGVEKVDAILNRMKTTRFVRSDGVTKVNLSSTNYKGAIKEAKVLSKLNKGIKLADMGFNAWDIGNGMYELVSHQNPSDGNPFKGIPIVGGFFEASDDLLQQTEQMFVESSIKSGYQNSLILLTQNNNGGINNSIGRRSSLIGIFVTEDAYKTIMRKGYLAMGEYRFGTDFGIPTTSNRENPQNSNGVNYSNFLIFTPSSASRISQIISFQIK